MKVHAVAIALVLAAPPVAAQSFDTRLSASVVVTPGERTVVPAEIVNTGSTTLSFAASAFNLRYGLSGVSIPPGDRAGIVIGTFVSDPVAGGSMPAGFLFKLAPAFAVVEPSGAVTGFNFTMPGPGCSNAAIYQVTDVLNGPIPDPGELTVAVSSDSTATSTAAPGTILACLSYVPGIPAGWGLSPSLGGNPNAPSLTISGAAVAGATADFNAFGLPGDAYFLFYSLGVAIVPTPFGTIWLDLASAHPFLSGVVPASGASRVAVPIPPGFFGPATIHAQAAVLRGGALLLTNRAVVTIP